MQFYKYQHKRYSETFLYRVTKYHIEARNAKPGHKWTSSTVFYLKDGIIHSDYQDIRPEDLILLKDDDPIVLRALLEEL